MTSRLRNHLRRGPASAVLGTAVGLALLTGCSGDADPGSAPAASTPSTSAATTPTTPTTAPGPPPVTASGPPPVTASAVGTATRAPVPVAQPAPFGDGLVATVTRVEEVQLSARGPGEVAGPGVAAHLRLHNGTAGRVDLGGVVVTASYGASPGEAVPADQSDAAPSAVPAGVLEPGADVEGVWVFSTATGAAASLQLVIGSLSSTSVVVVRA